MNIDAELLVAAKKLAERENKTAGQVISELLRQALSRAAAFLEQGSLWFPACSFPWWRRDQSAY